MPVLSAAVNAPYVADNTFVPITTFPDINDIPDYTLQFKVPRDYQGTDFAFDAYERAVDLVSPDIVDKHFLICRYERLFARKGIRSRYHCVPWMAVPCIKPTQNTYAFTKRNFVLDVGGLRTLLTFSASNAHRGLKLSASQNVKATWLSKRNASGQKEFLDVPNIALFQNDLFGLVLDSVDIEVQDGQYDDAGAYVQISDSVDNKVVAKVRIIFLETLNLRVFPIQVTDEGTGFRFDRLSVSAMPRSIESWGGPTTYQHGKIVDDANAYGFNQIGIKLDFDSTGTTLIDIHNSPMELSSGSATLAKIDKSIRGTALPHPIATIQDYRAVLQAFLHRVGHLQYQIGNQTEKHSKFSTIFIFVTPFQILPNTTGVTFGKVLESPTSDARTQHSVNPVAFLPLNTTLFETGKALFPTLWDWIRQEKEPVKPILTHVHQFATLVHEGSHALFVNHLFTKAKNFPEIDVCAAHKWLRLFILRDHVMDVEMLFEYDEIKVCIDDLTTGTTIQGRSETLFDLIISRGVEKGIKKFIDDKVFNDGPRPAGWNDAAVTHLAVGDLVFWLSLNDLVRFSEQNGIDNIMDYDPEALEFNPVSGEAYIKQVPVKFNRFQWELIRKTVKKLKEKELIP